MEKISSKSKLAVVMTQIDKLYGKNSIYQYGSGEQLNISAISTGSFLIDEATGIGGVPEGRIIEIYGPESCVASNTKVNIYAESIDGDGNFHKRWNIKRLFERFHNINIPGKGNCLREQTKNYEYYISSMNEDEKIIRNKICDVVKTGIKECFQVVTKNGHTITATKDHKFYVGNGYKNLESLLIGGKLFIHDNTPYKSEEKKKFNYKSISVKYHPSERWKRNTTERKGKKYVYNYCSLKYALLVVEASINGLQTSEYRELLNTKSSEYLLEKLKFVDVTIYDIHHKDFDHKNDSLDNLEVILKSKHYSLHSKLNHNKLRFAVNSDTIISITPVGKIETYDVKCYVPNNNYIANRFVVHNSGKTTLCLHIIAEAQKKGITCAFIDAEHALDPIYAGNIGVNMDDILLSQPDFGEQALDITSKLTDTGEVGLIIVDSVAALVPKSEIDGEIGDAHMALQARMMSQALRMITGQAKKTNTTIIFINQLRSKIGVMFGNPETTTGGNALKFYASMRIDIRRIGAVKVGEEVIGNQTKVKIAKSKVSSPFKVCVIEIRYGEGIDNLGELIILGIKYEIIEKSGAWYKISDKHRYNGKEKLRAALKSNEKLVKFLKKKLFGE